MNLYRCTKCGVHVSRPGKPEDCPVCSKIATGSHEGNRMERIRNPAEYFE